MNALPNEILLNIFNKLDFKSKLSAKSVCKKWKQCIRQLFFNDKTLVIKDTNGKASNRYNGFSLYGFEGTRKRSVLCMKTILKDYEPIETDYYRKFIANSFLNYSGLRVLYLCLFSSPLKDDLLSLLTKSCSSRNLIQISIIGSRYLSINRSEVLEFCLKFPNLKIFQFEARVLEISSRVIEILIVMLQKLEVFILMDSLNRFGRHFIVNDSDRVKLLFKYMSPNIKVMKVPGSILGRDALNHMADRNAKHLLSLHILGFDEIRTIEIISRKFQSIISLTLCNISSMETETEGNLFISQISKLERLVKLHLQVESENHILNYNAFQHLNNCKKLVTIRIESTRLTSQSIESIARFVPQLVRLDLTYVTFRDNTDQSIGISWIQQMKNIECIKLSTIPEIYDKPVIAIIKSCNQLRCIDLSRSELITVSTLMAIIEKAKQMPHKQVKTYFHYFLINTTDHLLSQLPVNLVVKYQYLKSIVI